MMYLFVLSAGRSKKNPNVEAILASLFNASERKILILDI